MKWKKLRKHYKQKFNIGNWLKWKQQRTKADYLYDSFDIEEEKGLTQSWSRASRGETLTIPTEIIRITANLLDNLSLYKGAQPMTEAEALALPARELDALVAERVMGWERDTNAQWERWVLPNGRVKYTSGPSALPQFKPSTTWDGMGLVVERLGEYGWAFTLESDGAGKWEATFWAGDTFHDSWIQDSAPRAVCIAALKALGVLT